MKRLMKIANPILLCLAVIFSRCEDTTEPGGTFGAGPSLISPANGVLVESQQTLFRWNGVDAASGYEVAVSADSLFDTSLASRVTAGTELVVDSLPNVGRIYWRVRSISTVWGMKGPWSERALFSRFRTFVLPLSSTALCATPDSGCVLADGYLVSRLDKIGHVLWQTSITGFPRSIKRVPTGGFVVAGVTSWGEAWRLDDSGRIAWSKSYGVMYTSLESITPTSDGGFVASANQDLYHLRRGTLMRLNSMGDTLWTRPSVDQFGGGFEDVAIGDSGTIWTAGIDAAGALFERRDSSGYPLWTYGRADCGPRYHQHWGTVVSMLGDGTAMVAMTSECTPAIMIRLDGNGTAIWEKPNGVVSLVPLPGGSTTVLTAGPYLVNYTISGATQWSTKIPTSTNLVAIAPSGDGGYYIGGSVLIKTDPKGMYIDAPPAAISNALSLRTR